MATVHDQIPARAPTARSSAYVSEPAAAAVPLTDGRAAAPRRAMLALPLVVALAAVIVCYAGTIETMVSIWLASDTFTHGFVVVPVVLWLIWRRRAVLRSLPIKAEPAMLVPMMLVGFVWLLGALGEVNVVEQVALVTLVILAVPALVGYAIARSIAYPLAILYFCVPFGEFAIPTLMQWTADFAVHALRLSGVPVFQLSNHIEIPSGQWSVVDTCSGIRYVIASAFVGALYAYLSYRSWLRRAAFLAVSLVVPVVANWVRAYMIVLIAHLSNNRLAVGVDHLIAGWIFFGFVVGLTFWIGSRWHQVEAPVTVVDSTHVPADGSATRLFTVAIAFALGSAIWPALGKTLIHSPPDAPRLAVTFAPGYSLSPQSAYQWKSNYHGMSASVQGTVEGGGIPVGLSIAYYRNQTTGRRLVSSVNDLVNFQDVAWARERDGYEHVVAPGAPDRVRATVVAKVRGGERVLVWSWYWIDGRLTSSEAEAKLYTAWSRLRGHGDDGAAVVIFTRDDAQRQAARVLSEFLAANGARIVAALEQARSRP